MAIDNKVTWNSRRYDSDTKLHYYKYRHYNPALGRWLSRDPIEEKGGLNLYGFVLNRVLNLWDVFGLRYVIDDWGKECCEDDLQEWEMRIDSPDESVRKQMWDNIKNGKSPDHDIDSGHTFLVDNNGTGYGFYPTVGWFGNPGEVDNTDGDHDYTHSRTLFFCPESAESIRKQIEEDTEEPPTYNLTGTQCTSWACDLVSNGNHEGKEPYDLAREDGYVEIGEQGRERPESTKFRQQSSFDPLDPEQAGP